MKRINYEMSQAEIDKTLSGLQSLKVLILTNGKFYPDKIENDSEMQPIIKEVKAEEELLSNRE